MIPNNLLFVWLGKKIPQYVLYTIEQFKYVNPSFNIIFYYDNLSNPTNIITYNYIKYYNQFLTAIINNDQYVSNDICFDLEMKSYTGYILKKKITDKNYILNRFIATISNIIRVYLVYKYGGIYLDCDTFPVKPFDNYILEESFQAYHDNFWFGGHQEEVITNNQQLFQKKSIGKYIRTFYENIKGYENYKNKKFLINKEKFYNCKLQYGEKVLNTYVKNDYYIDHYINKSYKNLKNI